MKLVTSVFLWFLIAATTVFSQNRPDPAVPQGTNLEVPEGWEVRLDHPSDEIIIGSSPDSSDLYFVNMTPGWHITTGPAGIFYHPANTASGAFTIHTELHFFNPEGRNREGYGIFWGGKNLQNQNQEYLYFLLRNTGEFLIKKRLGENTELIQNWTPHDAIKVYENTEEFSVKNDLSVTVGEQTIFYINGEEAASYPSSALENDGIFGLRVNHSVNLHISDLGLK